MELKQVTMENIQRIIRVSEEEFPGDPMHEELVVRIAVQRAMDSMIQDLRDGVLCP